MMCPGTKALIFLTALAAPAAADTYSFALASPDIFGTISLVSGNPNYNLEITINAGSDIPGPLTDALYGIAFQVNQVLTVGSDTVYSISGVTEANISGKTETATGTPDSLLPASTSWTMTGTSGINSTTLSWQAGQNVDLILGAPSSGNTYGNLQSPGTFKQHNPYYLTTGAIVFDVQIPNLLSTNKVAVAGTLKFGGSGTTLQSVTFIDTSVPEPAPAILIGSGVVIILVGSHRKLQGSGEARTGFWLFRS